MTELSTRDFVDDTIGGKFLHMHLDHDPIPTVPPRGIFDYTHPSGEVYDPLSFNGSARKDGSTAVFCLGRENEVFEIFHFISFCGLTLHLAHTELFCWKRALSRQYRR